MNSSRANGAKSRGPTTPAGKQTSSQNPIAHGLTAKTVVLTNESQDRFESLLQSYTEELQPQTRIQADLIQQMAVSKWRQQRLWAIETATLDLAMDRQDPQVAREFETIDEPTRLATAFQSAAETGTLGLFHRYETSMRRSWDKALDRLLTLQAKTPKLPSEPSPKNEHTEPDPLMPESPANPPANATSTDQTHANPITQNTAPDLTAANAPTPIETTAMPTDANPIIENAADVTAANPATPIPTTANQTTVNQSHAIPTNAIPPNPNRTTVNRPNTILNNVYPITENTAADLTAANSPTPIQTNENQTTINKTAAHHNSPTTPINPCTPN